MGAPRNIGPYEIIEKIGAGGMGTVYRARHGETGQIVALKVMRLDLAEDDAFLRRFHREATVASSVSSPNIVSVIETGQEEDTPYIAMELVEGESLASLMRRSEPLPLTQALDIAVQIAQGLYAAEQKGITHRDISPQNIMMTADGTAKIADFGIARLQSSGTLTGTGLFIGKPQYSAPETFDGRADTRSDVYSLGIVLFEMLSGKPPFVGPTPLATMDMHMRHAPPRLADLGVRVPATVEEILAKCLAKDPGQRFQNPRQLLSALTNGIGAVTVGSSSAAALPVGTGGAPPRTPPESATAGGGFNWRPLLFAGGAALAVVAIVAALLIAIGGGSGGDDAADTVLGASATPKSSRTSPTPSSSRGPSPVGGSHVASPTSIPDADSDGIVDASDQCDAEAETVNSFLDADGCPDTAPPQGFPDADSDGIPDSGDRCDTEKETLNGYLDADGCADVLPPPNIPDSDGDGIPDASDQCDFEVETINGYIDADGCPDVPPPPTATDADGDGISDSEDACDNQDETVNGYQDSDGCPDTPPDPDPDGDGFPNSRDTCDNEPETFNGYQDNDGCPDSPPDPDPDGDGYPNSRDTCDNEPETFNGYLDDDGCPDNVPTPNAPSNLTVTPLDPYTLQLDWADNSNNEDGFEIADCVPPLNSSGCSIDQTVGPNVVSHVIGGLDPGTYKCFSMRSFNAYASSDWSPQYVCATTPPVSTPTYSGTITFDRGDWSSYNVGDTFSFCYTLEPEDQFEGYFYISVNGGGETLLYSNSSLYHQNCLGFWAWDESDQGQVTLRAEFWVNGNLVAQAYTYAYVN